MPLILALRKYPGAQPPAPLQLERGEASVGRCAGADLLLDDLSVSRRHCTIAGEGMAWQITDTSTGGTMINGHRLTAPHMLRHGDVIGVGGCEIVAMLQDADKSAAPPAGRDSWGRPVGAAPVSAPPGSATAIPNGWSAAPQPAPVTTIPPQAADAVGVLLQAAGLSRAHVTGPDAQVLAACGALLRAVMASFAVQAADRAKARADLGIAAETDPPLPPEALLQRLLALPPAEAQGRIAAMCGAIDAHQRALKAALQASLHHALDQFAPASIKTSARSEAEAWRAYEQAFGTKDGFVEVFAKAFAQHYAAATKG